MMKWFNVIAKVCSSRNASNTKVSQKVLRNSILPGWTIDNWISLVVIQKNVFVPQMMMSVQSMLTPVCLPMSVSTSLALTTVHVGLATTTEINIRDQLVQVGMCYI